MIHSLQLEECEALWINILKDEPVIYPFYTYDWHMAWKKSLAPTLQTTVYSNDKVLVSLVKEGDTAHFSGGEEIADYLDCIGNNESKQAFWTQVLPILSTQGIKKLQLRNIPAHSPTITALQALGATVEEEDMTPTMILPETDEAYLQSLDRKDRHEFKRKVNKFELSYPDIIFSVTKNINIQTLITLMKRSEDKHIFLTREMESFFTNLPTLSDIQMLQANLLLKDGTSVASVVLFVVHQTLLLYNSGYDTSFQGSGFYLKAKMILWAIENRYKEYNFLQGQERYKYELGGKNVPVYKITYEIGQ